MNNRKITQFLKIIIVFVFCMLARTEHLFAAWDFDPNLHIEQHSVDLVNKTITFEMIVHNAELSPHDNLGYMEVAINGTHYFTVVGSSWNTPTQRYGPAYSTYPSATELTVTTHNDGQFRILNVGGGPTPTMEALPSNNDFTSFKFTIPLREVDKYQLFYFLSFPRLCFEDFGYDYGTEFSGALPIWPNSGNFGEYFMIFPEVGWPLIDVENFIASDDDCNNVNIEWDLIAGEEADLHYELFKDFNLLDADDTYISSYNDNLGPNPPMQTKEYGLSVGYGPNLVGNVWLTDIGGPPIGGFNNPLTFTATDHSCDGATLNWDDGSTGANTISYLITRNPGNVTYTPQKGTSTYQVTDVLGQTNYTYTIKSVNECNFMSSGLTSTSNYVVLTPPSTLNFSQSGNSVLVTWPDGAGESSYTLTKTFSGGASEIIENIPANSTSYLDNNVQSCVTYTYTIKAINSCNPNGIVGGTNTYKFLPGLNSTFTSNDFRVDKGYSASTVHMEWVPDNNAASIADYIILRRELGSNNTPTQIATVTGATGLYNDNTALAGVLYDYFIFGVLVCEGSYEYTDTAYAIGFRSPFGTVSGQVNYTGAIAVEDVRISGESTSGQTGTSLLFNGSESLQVAHKSSLNAGSGITIELWLKPSSHATDFTLVEKANSFSLKHIGTNYEFTVFTSPTNSQKISLADNFVNLNNYSQLTATLYNDTLQLYLNGNRVQSNFTLLGGVINNNTNSLEIGNGLLGNLDEFRYYVEGKDAKEVEQSYGRILSGTEDNLKIYLRMNEKVGTDAYDFSHVGTSFNRNHASLIGSPTWSYDIPSTTQLSIKAYTDAQGNYVMVAPYSGAGETFIITPSYLTHNFDPSTRALFIGEGAAVHNNINFEDISSFTVQGNLFYHNTSCAVEGATIFIDGNSVVSNGSIVKTDAQGDFTIQVPIGKHSITVEKQGHYMNIGRFPESGTFDFQNDLAGVSFEDSTLLKVVGRVVGGLKQASYIPGLGKSTNNIGQARIIIKSQQGNGCYTDTLFTDANTGEYITYLPPIRYIPSVIIPSNLTIDFGVLNLLDLANAPGITTSYDTINGLVDSVQFNKQQDYIYRVEPQIVVKDKDGIHDFIGDTSYTYIHPNGDVLIDRNLRTNPFSWPIFNGTKGEVWYTCLITAFESYSNYDDTTSTPILDTVPTTDGRLIINNELCLVDSGELELSEINTIDSLMYLYYHFKLGSPNFNENVSIPEYSYVKTFEVNILFPSGNSIAWKPNIFNGTPTGQFSNVDNRLFRGYVLGTKSNGQQFFTEGPQVPEYVLRDPPGSNSSATRGIGTTKSITNNWTWSLGGNIGVKDDIYAGTKDVVGIGVAKVVESESNIVAGFTAEVTGGEAGTESIVITNIQEWGTNSSSDLPGRGSDIYIGKSKNVTFGISETLEIISDTVCGRVDCIGTPFDSLSFFKSYGLSVIPGGYETQFIYNENQIKTYLIPELINLRNIMMLTDSRYHSYLANDDPNYGKNNDDVEFSNDPIINALSSDDIIDFIMKIGDSTYVDTSSSFVSSLTLRVPSSAQQHIWDSLESRTSPGYDVLDGPSYFFDAQNLEDSLLNDSVRWINNQIKHWEQAIMLNEWEKVNISNNQVRQKLKQVELTKLVNKYKESLKAYEVIVITGGVAGGIEALSSFLVPTVGAAFDGYASFAITTATGIAAGEFYDDVLQFENELVLINNKFGQTAANYSISGGNTYTSSMTHESASTYTTSMEYGMNASLDYEVKLKLSNTGTGFKKSIGLGYSSGREWSTGVGSNETISFTLNDPDQGDYFSVDVHPSLLGWGPVFKLRPGGATACPHEDAQLTEYYMDEPANAGSNPNYPLFELNARTLQIDKPSMTVAPSLLTNIPTTDPAVFDLTINNDSEANLPREYTIQLYSASNPFGAIVRVDGAASVTLTIPPVSSVNKVLTVNKGPGPVYEYDSLMVIVYAPCQYAAGTSDNGDIVDTVYISAHFLPTCTDVNFATPDDQWVLNSSFKDTMPIDIIDYNINFYDFNSIRLDYKPSSSPNWVGLQTFYRDTAGLNNPQAQLIPTTATSTSWDWQTDQIVDGDYDLRLVSQCNFVSKYSATHTGLMDRINPHPFGTPSPADGILDPNDDISIRFNEPIDLGSLTSLNFDIRGVINGSETNHSSNLYFDGIDDYVEITGGAPIQRRDFTIEFSAKRSALGQEPIVTQGPDGNEQIYIGFDSGNHLECRINGQSVSSLNTFADNEWHYFAVSYNYDLEQVLIYEASDNSTSAIINDINASEMYEKYDGTDKFYIGKDLASNTYFKGNLDDVRVWNTARSLNEFSLMKSIQISANEPGLLYNWRFDEAEGVFAKDHVRSRDGIVYGAEWTVEPSGSALGLDGIDDYVKIISGDVAITDGMDFTLEFWYNSTQSGVATLVSNGKGDGLEADSIRSWNIAKDASGLIHVYHNGLDFVATNTNTFDGEWHHFALVLNRLGNLTSYLDGNLENSIQANSFRRFSAAAFYIGARGYNQGPLEFIDNHFEGSIDEFRFWDASRKFEQIARDKNNRMMGDEFALRLYMPFENYELDPTGVPLLTASFDEQIDLTDTIHIVTNLNGAILTNITPKIKIQRPVESIAFTYSVNNDEIIITPTTNQALIENVTLDITVKNVLDLNGNKMESPKTWIAYMDKNQVVWQDDLLAFDKAFEAPLAFTSGISNEGGAAKNFTIENLPSWLTVSPTSGIIQPNSQMTINFTVDPNVNIGDYSQDIHLLTDFGFAEKLTIDLKVREEEPDWEVDPADYLYSMSIIGYLKIRDVVSTSEEDILAAFVDDECRGVAHLQYIPQLDRYLVFLDAYSNVTNGENLHFKIWDASAGTMFTEVEPLPLPFVENTLIGTVNNPQLFETNYEVSVSIPLVNGWNWISDFLYNSDSTDLDITMASLESSNGDEIKTLTHGFSSYVDTVIDGTAVQGWLGDINQEGIRPELGYKLKVSKIDTLIFKGDILDPTSRTINLEEGWNWIGFISLRNQSVTQAFGNHNPVDGDLVKGKSQFAVYNTQIGWVGSLQALKPGSSYMYKSANTVDFVYPFAGMFKSGLELDENEYVNETWEVDYNTFASNMTTIARINSDCDYIQDNQGLTLGVFDDKGVIRGISPIEMGGGIGRSFLTSSGDNSESLTWRLLDNTTKETYNLEQEIDFTPNAHLGSLDAPYEVYVSEEQCFKMKADAGVIKEYFKVYPTILEDILYIDYIASGEDAASTVEMYNVWGQKVMEQNLSVEGGFNRIELDVSQLELAVGVYHFVLNSNGARQTVKLISK